ncbi:MAG TPA: hypothetical protein VGK16_10660 [Candidatus Limnocylindrales bacterium]|jgi:hypothetical protein
MSASTPRTISNAPDMRQLLVAVGALTLAVALLVAVMISRQVSFQGASAPAVPASVAHDHGWSTADGSLDLIVRSANGGLRYTGIPYPTGNRGLIVSTAHGGIRYTGIPYPAPDTDRQGGSNGTRFAQ